MTPGEFLFLNLALAFYNVGTIWAHEIDIFRSWKLIGKGEFHQVQQTHFHKIPYWIFAPVSLSLLGGIALLWYHPKGSPMGLAWAALFCQLFSGVLTGLYWGRWQAKLANDPLGAESPYLAKILKTHWIRTTLINAYAILLLAWVSVEYGGA
jgi:hypothetical protein